jgi:hypothetical protein
MKKPLLVTNIDDLLIKSDLIKQLTKKYGKADYYLTSKKEPDVIKTFKKQGTRIIKPSKLESL